MTLILIKYLLGILFAFGGVKYIDEAGDALKATAKYGDEAAEVSKTIEKVTDSLDDISTHKNLTKDAGNIVDDYMKNNVSPHFRENIKGAFTEAKRHPYLDVFFCYLFRTI